MGCLTQKSSRPVLQTKTERPLIPSIQNPQTPTKIDKLSQKTSSPLQDIETPQKKEDTAPPSVNEPVPYQIPNRQRMIKEVEVYSRFQIVNKLHKSNEGETTIQGVIIGPCGNGKTCLINLICDSSLPHGTSRSSLTKDVTQLSSHYQLEPQFVVYDTPGTTTTAVKDKIPHAILLKSVLTWKRYNAVFILIRYSNRYQEMVRTMISEMKILGGYEKSIVFLVSHIDYEEQPAKAVNNINALLDQYEISNQVLYFSNITSSQLFLTYKIYYIAASMAKVKIQINEQSFMNNFNIKIQKGEQICYRRSLNQKREQMDEIVSIYADYALSLSNNPQKQSILQDLEIKLKRQLYEVLEKFRIQFSQIMIVSDYYQIFYTLQKQMIDAMSEFHKRTKPQEHYRIIRNQVEGAIDVRDLIKRCPNCGLIWMRIQKCPTTTCGNRPSCFFDFSEESYTRYSITRNGKQFKIDRIPMQNLLINSQPKQKEWMAKKRGNHKYLGCNQAMNFTTLPRLKNIDEILKQWYDVQTMDEVVRKFQQEKNQEKMRQELEENARLKFQTFRYKN